jgi:Rho-binding antiterminator
MHQAARRYGRATDIEKEQQMSEYEPVDCGLHDRLEELATLRQPARIEFRDERGELREARSTIDDVFTNDGAEFVRTADGEEIRLDRIENVDGQHYGAQQQ